MEKLGITRENVKMAAKQHTMKQHGEVQHVAAAEAEEEEAIMKEAAVTSVDNVERV